MIGPLTFVLFYCTMKRRDNGSVNSFRYILVLGKNILIQLVLTSYS